MIAIHTKFMPATNTRGARIKAYTADGRSITVPMDSALDGEKRHFEAVKAFVAKHLPYAGSLDDMRYGDSADGRGYVFCFANSIVGK